MIASNPGPVPGTGRDRLESHFAALSASFSDSAARTFERRDPEAIHDLRVAARRLLAFLRVWRELLPEEDWRTVIRAVRGVRRRAGPARDLEVQIALLVERLPRHPDEVHDAVLPILEVSQRKLERRRVRLAVRVRPKRLRELLRGLDACARGLSTDFMTVLRAFEKAHERERKRCHQALDAIHVALESHDDASLHQARIAIKKWRYAVECLSGGATPPLLATLREIQGVLGTAQDCVILGALLSRNVGDPRGKEGRALIPLIEELETERNEQVLRFDRLAAALLCAAPGTTHLVPAPDVPRKEDAGRRPVSA